MAKGKITTNITKSDYVFIDGSTGQELSQEEFNRRHKKGFGLGNNRVAIGGGAPEEGSKEAQKL